MMSAQNQAEHGVIQSSIALLQERFKQLQRVKEMREKKELLTMFSDNYPINNTTTANPNNTTTTNNNDGDVVDVNDDEVQIFLPPNYYCSNRNKPSCHYSSPTSSSLSPSSSGLSHNNNLNDISLSLWPPAMSYTNATATATAAAAAAAAAAAEHFRRATPLTTMSTRPSSCVSSAYNKFEDSHVSDVDTTLHL